MTATDTSPIDKFKCDLDDEDLCGMTQDTRNQFFWSWRGNTSQPVMGPVGDHTSGSTSGTFALVIINVLFIVYKSKSKNK